MTHVVITACSSLLQWRSLTNTEDINNVPVVKYVAQALLMCSDCPSV